MSRPENFIYSSDFATLKNDGIGTTSITIPGGVSILAGGVYTSTADITVGSALGESRVRISSSKIGSRSFLGSFGSNRTGSGGDPYSIYCVASRISSTQIRCVATIPNPYGFTLNCSATPETFTYIVNTFLPPVT